MKIIFCGVILRVFLAIINVYYITLPGAEYDAITFHEIALLVSKSWDNINLNIGWIYATILGVIYKYTFDTLFMGCVVSVFAWFISAIILKKTLNDLNFIDFNVKTILFFYAFLPSSLIFTSITLREPFQLLLYNLMIFFLVNIFYNNKKKYIPLLLLALVALAMLHKIFLFLAIFIILLLILLILNKFNYKYKISFCIIFFLIFYFFYENIYSFFLTKLPIDKMSIYQIMQGHINNMTISRASYNNDIIIINNFYDIILYSIRSLINYFLQPFPSNHQNIFDTFLFIENLLRLFFIIFIFVNICKFTNINYTYFIILFVIYFLTEFLWALGTNNWGSAVRHHLPVSGILLLLSFYSIKKIIK